MDRRSQTTSPQLYDINQSFALTPRDATRSVSSATTTTTTIDKKSGLTAKLRQRINTVTGKRQDPHQSRQQITADLTHLSPQSQETILRTVEAIKIHESEIVIDTLDESRTILKSSLDEFKREQDEYRQQLEEIMREKEAAIKRPKENTIPLSILLKQKHDIHGLADLRPNSSMNPTYQAHFEALLVNNPNQQQHPSDKAAVVKYIRRRERRKRAEENKKNHHLSEDKLEQKTAELIQNMEGVDVKLEHERQRQNELMRHKMNEKKAKNDTLLQAHEIIGQANEANLLRERMEKIQREKIEARVTAVRQQQSRSPSNLINVQSRVEENEENGWELNDEDKETTKRSIQRLQRENGYGMGNANGHLADDDNDDDDDLYHSSRATPLYGDGGDNRKKVPEIEI